MRFSSRLILALLPLASILLMGAGPGIHVRESDRLLDQLRTSDPVWEERAQLEKAAVYLHLGAISPDLDWASNELTFGHSRGLFYHLLDKALEEQNDLHVLFAAGGIAHQATDALWESFFTPTLMASAPLGMFDLYGDVGNNRGEAETITEGFGDLVLGDWHSIVDILFALWLDSDEAKAEAIDLISWYCEGGKEYFGYDTDCSVVQTELAEKLSMAEDYVGFMTYAQAQSMVDILIDQPLTDLADTAVGGGLTSFLGEVGEISPWATVDLERFKASPFCNSEFWNLYNDMDHLGPTWAFRYVTQRLSKSFPGWEPDAMASGNIRSIMAFLPDLYTVNPDLTLRSLEWTDPQGSPLPSVAPGQSATQAQVSVQLYVARDFHHSVRGVVRKDAPGIDAEPGEIVGEALVQIDQDPLDYTTDDPVTLTVPFQTDTSEAVGFYLDIYVDDEAGPTYTTNWDHLWLIDDLDMSRPIYTQNFGSYGFWPASLPISPLAPEYNPSTLLVKVRQKPFGPALQDATVAVVPKDSPGAPWMGTTSANGVAVFDWLASSVDYLVSVTSDDPLYSPVDQTVIQLKPGEKPWLVFEVDRKVSFLDVPAWFDPTKKLELSFDANAFFGQTYNFEIRGLDELGQPLTETFYFTIGDVMLDNWPALPDGSTVFVEVLPVYVTSEAGIAGLSQAIGVDSSPASVSQTALEVVDLTPCLPRDGSTTLPFFPQSLLVAQAVEPHSPIQASLACDNAAIDVPVTVEPEGQEEGTYLLSVTLPANVCTTSQGSSGKLELWVTNGPGLVTKLQVTNRSIWDEERLCPAIEPELDVVEQDAQDTTQQDVAQDTDTAEDKDVPVPQDLAPDTASDTSSTDIGPGDVEPKKKSSGCSSQQQGSSCALLLLSAAALLLGALRRRHPNPASVR